MTLVVVIILGAGVILVISSLENSPLMDTFNSILSGQPIVVQTKAGAGSTITPPAPSGTGGGNYPAGNPGGSAPGGTGGGNYPANKAH